MSRRASIAVDIPLNARSHATLLSLAAALFAAAVHAQTPAPSPAGRPISESVERLVKKAEDERNAPCRRAAERGVPCYPTSVEAQAPKYSVKDTLRQLPSDTSPSPDRPPTVSELSPHFPGALSPVLIGKSFDPVCAAKSALKSLKGRNDIYFLYRVWDRHGNYPLMLDHPIATAAYASIPEFEYQFLGKFEGECEAVAAFRRAMRESVPQSKPSPTPEKSPK